MRRDPEDRRQVVRSYELVCPYCQKQYTAGRAPREGERNACRSNLCQKKRNAERQLAWERKFKEEHGYWSARRFKEDPLNKAKYSQMRNREISVRERYPAQTAARDAIRRSRVKSATVEIFDPEEVFERDGWICQICEEPVDKTLKHPDPMCKSLDHKTPLSRGGEHSRENSQLAHLVCNVQKGPRLSPPRQTRNP